MGLYKEFDRRVASIYGLGSLRVRNRNAGDESMDTRHAEFEAMAEVFLGRDFNRAKLQQVENLQILLREQHASLLQRYEAQKLSPEKYVDSFNALLSDTFAKCEKILGKKDFVKLFGAPRRELGGFIDKQIFLESDEKKVEKSSEVEVIRVKPLRVTARVSLATASPTSRGLGMTKASLVGKMARDASITKKAAEMALTSLMAGVRDSLRRGKKVTLVGFGTFSVARRAARKGRNPQTGKAIRIPAARVPRFRAGKALKDSLK